MQTLVPLGPGKIHVVILIIFCQSAAQWKKKERQMHTLALD